MFDSRCEASNSASAPANTGQADRDGIGDPCDADRDGDDVEGDLVGASVIGRAAAPSA